LAGASKPLVALAERVFAPLFLFRKNFEGLTCLNEDLQLLHYLMDITSESTKPSA
jgi:hypothetical protein